MGDILSNLALGLSVALSLNSLWYCFVGVLLGTFVGVLPGLGALVAIAMLLPLTFSLDPTSALIMLAGIYYGSAYGGSTAAILLNLPGTPSSAIVCLDGYPMSQQGRAGVALFITTIASFVGSFIGLLMLAGFSPALTNLALSFSAPDFFSLMVLGLVAAALLSSGLPFRSLTMICFGLILGIVGTDVSTGLMRFTYGSYHLFEGLPVVAIALGIFGVPEVMQNAGRLHTRTVAAKGITFRSMIPSGNDWRRSIGAMLRGTGVGSFFGALPGTGGTIAAFMTYAAEKRINTEPERFGKGAIEGVAGPEAANNAAVQTAFIPTLALGIPGDVVMAMMMGAMIIHGITPGPTLMTQHPDMYWGLVVSFLIGNLLLLVLNIPLIGIWVRILSIPYSILYPFIVAFICIGVYSVNRSVVDIYVLMGFGVLGVVMAALRFEAAPLILGIILGPMLEENLRRALTLFRGDYTVFVTRPISAIFLSASSLVVLWAAYGVVKRQRQGRIDKRNTELD